jgi:4-phospho-D-threonate 3-dehydrogenase / 4-phospho-D-erythronate 3-dehydrogenase
MSRPIIAITMGDPSGIGPEIVMRSLAHDEVYAVCRPLVVGDAVRLRKAASIVGSTLEVHAVSGPSDAQFQAGTVDVIDLSVVPADFRSARFRPSPARPPTVTSNAPASW